MDDGTSVLVAALVVIVGVVGGVLGIRRHRRRGPRVEVGLREAPSPKRVPQPTPGGIRAALSKTAARLRDRLEAALAGGTDSDVLDGVEEALVAADVGTRTSAAIIDGVRGRLGHGADASDIRSAVRDEIRGILPVAVVHAATGHPWIVLVTGVNGAGKTTTIGKLSALYRAEGRSVLLVAADTFRAAAIEQLGVWAERTGAAIVRHGQGADPSAVVFDGLSAAVARQVDVVLVDTAGRLHTRSPLMDELRKVRRTIERAVPGAPHEVLLVVDGTTGQNAMSQAKAFANATGVTGVIVTKLDGTAKGGVVVAMGHELGIPVRYVGVGEAVDDLRPFDRDEFVSGLLGD